MISLGSLDLSKQFGGNFQFLLHIDWNGTAVYYGMEEGVSPTVYGYVKDHGTLSLLSQTEGFGQVSSMSFTIFDLFGHVHDKYKNNNIYSKDVVATVYVAEYDGTNYVNQQKLFTGRIEEYEFNSMEREATFDVVSEIVEENWGYTPRLTDIDEGSDPNYDFWKGYLNEQTWPFSYGTYAEKIEAVRLTNIDRTITLANDVELTPSGVSANLFSGAITLNEDVTGLVDGAVKTVYIYDKDTVVKATGTFSGTTFTVATMSIDLWTGSAPLTPDPQFDMVRPTMGGTYPTFPLKGLRIRSRWSCASNGSCTCGYSHTWSQSVLEQRGRELQLDIEITKTGQTDAPTDCVYTYTLLSVYKHRQYEFNFKLSAGMSFYIDGEANQDIYVVDMKPFSHTGVGSVYTLAENDEYIELNSDEYDIKNTSVEGKFWTAISGRTHPDCTYIQLKNQSFLRNLTKFMTKGNVKEGIYVNLNESKTPDRPIREAINYIAQQLGWTTNLGSLPGIKANLVAASSLLHMRQEQSVTDLLSEMAWQERLGLRFRENVLEMLPDRIGDIYPTTLRSQHVIKDSLIFSKTDIEDITTVYKVTWQGFDLTEENTVQKYYYDPDNYGDREVALDLNCIRLQDDVDEIIEQWIRFNSRCYDTISVSVGLEFMNLEVYDYVQVNLPAMHLSSDSPLTNTHSPNTIIDDFQGFQVQEVNIDLNAGIVNLVGRIVSITQLESLRS